MYNILLIHSDQHRYDCLGVNGHPVVQTPYLNQLAAEGSNFTHAFCPIPLCTPARASLLTGQWPTQHGTLANPDTELATPFASELPTFSQVLKDAGYWLGYVGKWHVDNQKLPTDVGFERYIPEAAYVDWRQQQGFASRPRQNGWFGETDPAIPADASRLAWGADETIRLLQSAAARAQPFFIRWDPSEPHLPNLVPEPYASLYPPETLSPWPSFPDPLVGKPYIQHQQRYTWGLEDWNWTDWAPIVARYLGEITLLDRQIGRLLATLEELQLVHNTLVIYTSDHGDMCGAHGMIDKHYVMYDDVVRVPLIMRLPGVIPAESTQSTFVSSALDLAATFCVAAEQAVPTTFAGQALLSLGAGTANQPPRADIFATYHGNQLGLYSQRMVRTHQWKYVWNATAEDELYDLAADPAELVNVVGKAEHRVQLQLLRQRLVQWMEETGDPLLNPWIRQQLLNGKIYNGVAA